MDYTSRYSGGASVDPLSSLQMIPELAPEQQIAQPQNMNEQQNHSWAAMRAQMNANRRQAEEFRTKYNELVEFTKKYKDERAEFGKQLNKKDEEIKALQDEVGRTDLTRSPAFQEKYDAPLRAVQDDVARTLVDNGYTQDQAMDAARQILTADRKQIPDMIRELPTHVQGIIMVNAEKADNMWAARAQALDDWRNSAEGLAAVEARGSAIVNAQKIDKLTNEAFDIIRTMNSTRGAIPAYQVIDPVFVADREAKEQQFRAWVREAPESQRFAAMLEGFMAPKTYEMLETVMQENMQLKQALSGRARLSSPPVSAFPGSWAPPPPPPPKAPVVNKDGYSEADPVNPAQDIARQIFNQFTGQ